MITALILILLAIAAKGYQQDYWRSVALVTVAGLLWLFPVATLWAWLVIWIARVLWTDAKQALRGKPLGATFKSKNQISHLSVDWTSKRGPLVLLNWFKRKQVPSIWLWHAPSLPYTSGWKRFLCPNTKGMKVMNFQGWMLRGFLFLELIN